MFYTPRSRSDHSNPSYQRGNKSFIGNQDNVSLNLYNTLGYIYPSFYKGAKQVNLREVPNSAQVHVIDKRGFKPTPA